jgi:hypothetical protein
MKASELLDHEKFFDLVLLSLHRAKLKQAIAYTDALKRRFPSLPILLLTDVGAFVPRGTLSQSIETGYPQELMEEIARMLAGIEYIREVDPDATPLAAD